MAYVEVRVVDVPTVDRAVEPPVFGHEDWTIVQVYDRPVTGGDDVLLCDVIHRRRRL